MHTNWIAPSIEFSAKRWKAARKKSSNCFSLISLLAITNSGCLFFAKPRDVTSDRHVERRINEDQVGFPATQQR
jgi:hypothetical protein